MAYLPAGECIPDTHRRGGWEVPRFGLYAFDTQWIWKPQDTDVGKAAICVVADKIARNEGEAEKTDDAMKPSST